MYITFILILTVILAILTLLVIAEVPRHGVKERMYKYLSILKSSMSVISRVRNGVNILVFRG